jgi:hypothetical protein
MKLNNQNYKVWKYKVELLLVKEEHWDLQTKTGEIIMI